MYRTAINYAMRGAVAAVVLFFGTAKGLPTKDLNNGSVTLAWNPSPSPSIIGYNVYYGPASGNYTSQMAVGDLSNASVSNLVRGQYYYFAATALDNSGLESAYSNEAICWVPRSEVPFQSVQGVYHGLFYEPDQVRQYSAGAVALTVSPGGAYSGVIQMGVNRLSFHGRLNTYAQSTNIVARRAGRSLQLQLAVGTGAQTNDLFGTVSDGSWQAVLTGSRAVFSASHNPAPYAGDYNFVFPGVDGNASLPSGDGYAVVKISRGGVVQMAARLADGTSASQSAYVSAQGAWPLYVPLYAGNGSLVTWLTSTGQLTSGVSWIKPANPKTRYYAAGFTNQLPVIGSAYGPSSGANSLLNFADADAVFTGGDLAAAVTNSLPALTSNASSPGTGLIFRFSRSTGAFFGSALDLSTGHSPFSGVILQSLGAGFGFLLGPDQSSRVLIQTLP